MVIGLFEFFLGLVPGRKESEKIVVNKMQIISEFSASLNLAKSKVWLVP